MRSFNIAALACLGFCLQAAGPRAELYQWTDERGQVHVTDDGAKVPTGQSITLQPQSPGALEKTDREEAHSLALGSVAPTRAAPTREHVLLFQSSGHEISLDASLEDRLVCNFKADTGASLNTLPRWAADELRSVNAQIEFLLQRAVAERRGGPPAPPAAEREKRSR